MEVQQENLDNDNKPKGALKHRKNKHSFPICEICSNDRKQYKFTTRHFNSKLHSNNASKRYANINGKAVKNLLKEKSVIIDKLEHQLSEKSDTINSLTHQI